MRDRRTYRGTCPTCGVTHFVQMQVWGTTSRLPEVTDIICDADHKGYPPREVDMYPVTEQDTAIVLAPL